MQNVPSFVARFFQALKMRGDLYERLTYSRICGGDVEAWRLTPKQARKGTVVFSHATGNDALFPQLTLFSSLLSAGFEVFTFDLDGHGIRSTAILSLANIRTAIAEALAALRSPSPVTLVGHSLGGTLALAHAAADQSGVKNLVLISAPLTLGIIPKAVIAEISGFAKSSLAEQRSFYGTWGVLPAIGPFKRKSYPVRLRPEEKRNYIEVVKNLIHELKVEQIAGSVKVPTLLIYGDQDFLVPVKTGEQLALVLPKSELQIVKGGTHFSTPFEAGVERSIVRFLERDA